MTAKNGSDAGAKPKRNLSPKFLANSGKGRPKGVTNKINGDIREMIRKALDDAGGVAYLAEQARANPSAFMALIGRIIPKEVEAQVTGSMQIIWPLPRTKLDD